MHIADGTGEPSVWAEFLKWKKQDRRKYLSKMLAFEEDPEEDEGQVTWSWKRFFLPSIFWVEDEKNGDWGRRTGDAPDSYNLYDRKPDFRNNYGWSVALDGADYRPLKHSGIGVYLVNLTAVSHF